MDASTLRIAVLGKTGVGKSSMGNTMFGKEIFGVHHEAVSGTTKTKAVTGEVDGRSITFIDTPGFFDTDKLEEEQKSEVVKCITECSPGVHAFLIFLKVERYTKQEEEVIEKIKNSFTQEAFKYAILVFTHGDQLERDAKIEDFIKTNKSLTDLFNKCGGRCQVIDNRYWNTNQQSEYRSNKFQVSELLRKIFEMVMKIGSCYTNEMLKKVQGIDFSYFLKLAAGIGTGVLLGALLGVPADIFKVVECLATVVLQRKAIPDQFKVIAKDGIIDAVGAGAGLGVKHCLKRPDFIVKGSYKAAALKGAAAAACAEGAVRGGCAGHREADNAESTCEAIKNTAKAVWKETFDPLTNAFSMIGEAFGQQPQHDKDE